MADTHSHRIHGQARFATAGLLFVGILHATIGAWLAYEVGIRGDLQRALLLGILFAVGGGSIAASVMLRWRRPAGRIVAWCVLPFILIRFPLGTLAGLLIMLGLHSKEMREYLFGTPDGDGAAPKPDPLQSIQGQARYATAGLLFLGAFTFAFGAWLLYMLAQEGRDGVREYMTAYSIVAGGGALVATLLLRKRKPSGRIVAWCILPLYLINLPIGTIGAVFVIVGLHSREMRVWLFGDTGGPGQLTVRTPTVPPVALNSSDEFVGDADRRLAA